MQKMTQKQLMDILRTHIEQCEKDWNNLRLIGDKRQADIADGRSKEARELLWILQDVEIV